MPPFEITVATPDDVATIASFNLALAEESEAKRLDPATVLAGVGAVLGDLTKGRYFVARSMEPAEAGAVVGQLMVTLEWSDWRNGPMWWVQSVYVRQDFRRRGVLRALFAHVLAQAKREGSPAVRLYVEEHNAAARATYASLGMTGTGYLVLERAL